MLPRPLSFALLASAALSAILTALPARGEDRTRAVEDSINWHLNPFQKGGYSWPGGDTFNREFYRGHVDFVLDRAAACDRIDRAFERAGFHMKRDVAYEKDGVAFRATGYDADRKVGYIFATPETVGLFGSDPGGRDAAVWLSAEEAKTLEDRAPVTREFIAVVIPYVNHLGYQVCPYRDDKEKAELEKKKADTVESRLASLDGCVAEYVTWMAGMSTSEYPAPSAEPRNLLNVARWKSAIPEHHFPGECGVGMPRPLHVDMVKKFVAQWSAAAGVDLSKPFTYEKDGKSFTLTGYDPAKKIGYLWACPSPELSALAAQAEADGLRIAWISPADARFDLRHERTMTRYAPQYAEKAKAVQAIKDEKAREAATQALDAQVEEDNARPALDKLERRVVEFLEWAEKR
ncbi:MAG: hypothetical protein K8T20_06815 [Planctomycetes bacterium]|nr:hypothetical protein [Planctomycetota bacterium]